MAKQPTRTEAAEGKTEEFAEDLGKLLEAAKAKAENWIGKKSAIAEHLSDIRNTASELLEQLTGGVATPQPAASAKRRGRPPGSGRKRKRTMSLEARKAISDAQKARWAKQRRAQKKADSEK